MKFEASLLQILLILHPNQLLQVMQIF